MHISKEVLIVDHEPVFRKLMHRWLNIAGYETISAQNSEEALVALWERRNIGLVLLDVHLPTLSGVNIRDIIHKDFPEIKVSAYDKSEDLRLLIDKIETIFNSPKDLGKSENRFSLPAVALSDHKNYFEST